MSGLAPKSDEDCGRFMLGVDGLAISSFNFCARLVMFSRYSSNSGSVTVSFVENFSDSVLIVLALTGSDDSAFSSLDSVSDPFSSLEGDSLTGTSSILEVEFEESDG